MMGGCRDLFAWAELRNDGEEGDGLQSIGHALIFHLAFCFEGNVWVQLFSGHPLWFCLLPHLFPLVAAEPTTLWDSSKDRQAFIWKQQHMVRNEKVRETKQGKSREGAAIAFLEMSHTQSPHAMT